MRARLRTLERATRDATDLQARPLGATGEDGPEAEARAARADDADRRHRRRPQGIAMGCAL